MPQIRVLKPAVAPPKALVEGLKHEVYTVGTSIRQVSTECGMDVETVKRLLQGLNVEQATVGRLEAYLKALARNEFYATRSVKHRESGKLERLDSRFWAYSSEMWKVYKISSMRLERFQTFERRKKLVWLNHADYVCKRTLMEKFKPQMERFRVWLPDAWSYFRCKRFLANKLAALGVKA
jgi:hypothetical protein